MPPQNSNHTLKILIGVLVVLLIVSIGTVSFSILKNKNVSQNEQSVPTNIQNESQIPKKTTSEGLPVVIYTEEIGTTNDDFRSWPTVRILQKIGDAAPETLAEVGKIGEYPSSYQLSPDNKFLLVNLESKLQILNVSTKELKDLFIPKKQVLSVSYSPDTKQLFIWDQLYTPRDGDNTYHVHLFTLTNQKDQILQQGINASPFFGTVWRNDHTVVLNEAHGEFSTPWYFDLAKNQLSKTPGGFTSGVVSRSGKAMAVVKNFVDDVCNDFSGSAFSVYSIIDPVSGDILGTIGDSGNRVSVLAFSPDDTEAFYVAEKPWTNRDDCNKEAEKKYYKVEISSGQAVKISNVSDVLMSWDRNNIGALEDYDYNTSTWSISVSGQPIITSKKNLQLVGQFYN